MDFVLLPLLSARNVVILGLQRKNVWGNLAVGTQQWRALCGALSSRVSLQDCVQPGLTPVHNYNTVKPVLSGLTIKRTPSIKRTLSLVPILASYINPYNKPLFSGHLY